VLKFCLLTVLNLNFLQGHTRYNSYELQTARNKVSEGIFVSYFGFGSKHLSLRFRYKELYIYLLINIYSFLKSQIRFQTRPNAFNSVEN